MDTITYTDPIASLLGQWASGLNLYSILFRLALAFICATLIGCERAHKRHSAGLRTFIIVYTASASAMMLDNLRRLHYQYCYHQRKFFLVQLQKPN